MKPYILITCGTGVLFLVGWGFSGAEFKPCPEAVFVYALWFVCTAIACGFYNLAWGRK